MCIPCGKTFCFVLGQGHLSRSRILKKMAILGALGFHEDILFQPHRPPSEPMPRVVAPHLLAYNVNRPQIQAAR